MRAPSDTEAFQLLFDMVSCQSVSRNEAPFAATFREHLEQLGFSAHIDEAGNLIAEAGPQDAPLLALVGHIDTVPGNPPVHFDGSHLWGRGSVDAKSPFAAFVAAAARHTANFQSGNSAPLRIRIIGCVEEEVASSRGANHIVTNDFPGPTPDFLIVGEPSSWDGITLGYKGYISACLSLEDETCHGAHDTASVAERAARIWARITDAFVQPDTAMFDAIIPRLTSFNTSTTGQLESAALEVSLRLPTSTSPAQAFEQLATIAATESMQLTPHSIGIPAWSGPRTTKLHRALSRAILLNGGRPTYKVKSGTADLNLLAPHWDCPALAYGPGDAALDHRPDERIERAEFLRGIQVLEACMQSLASQG